MNKWAVFIFVALFLVLAALQRRQTGELAGNIRMSQATRAEPAGVPLPPDAAMPTGSAVPEADNGAPPVPSPAPRSGAAEQGSGSEKAAAEARYLKKVKEVQDKLIRESEKEMRAAMEAMGDFQNE